MDNDLLTCQKCSRPLRIAPGTVAGTAVSCPHCGARIVVGSPGVRTVDLGHSQPAPVAAGASKNPLLYTIGGAVLALLAVGGMLAAYTIGRGAAGPEQVAQEPARESLPAAGAAPNGPPPDQRRAATPRADSVSSGVESPLENRSTPTAKPPATTTNGAPGAGRTNDPSSLESRGAPVDDANRPRKTTEVGRLRGPDARSPPRGSGPARPVIVEVPVPVPVPVPFGVADGQAKPDLVVKIRWPRSDDSTANAPRVDHRAHGYQESLFVSLDRTLKTETKVTLKPEAGLSVDKTELTFAAGAVPAEQKVVLSGDGAADLATQQSRLVTLELRVSSKGLVASTGSVSVSVMRRNSFLGGDASTLVRDNPTSPSLTTWTWKRPGRADTALRAISYTSEHVLLGAAGGGPLRLRIDDKGYSNVGPPNSEANPQRVTTGNWQ